MLKRSSCDRNDHLSSFFAIFLAQTSHMNAHFLLSLFVCQNKPSLNICKPLIDFSKIPSVVSSFFSALVIGVFITTPFNRQVDCSTSKNIVHKRHSVEIFSRLMHYANNQHLVSFYPINKRKGKAAHCIFSGIGANTTTKQFGPSTNPVCCSLNRSISVYSNQQRASSL